MPCPACGEKADTLVMTSRWLDAHAPSGDFWATNCLLCGLRGPHMADEQSAIRAWNCAFSEDIQLRFALFDLMEKAERVNAVQHSGALVQAEDWSELYALANKARAVLSMRGRRLPASLLKEAGVTGRQFRQDREGAAG